MRIDDVFLGAAMVLGVFLLQALFDLMRLKVENPIAAREQGSVNYLADKLRQKEEECETHVEAIKALEEHIERLENLVQNVCAESSGRQERILELEKEIQSIRHDIPTHDCF